MILFDDRGDTNASLVISLVVRLVVRLAVRIGWHHRDSQIHHGGMMYLHYARWLLY